MALSILYQTCDDKLVQSIYGAPAFSSLADADVSEANMFTATAFLDSMYTDDNKSERFPSRANTPLPVSQPTLTLQLTHAHPSRTVVRSSKAPPGPTRFHARRPSRRPHPSQTSK